MIYVLKTQNKDVIIFDSILSFSETYSGSVTSHPVEDGTKISDHVITDNIKFRIQGVVSDYNFWNPLKDSANQSVKVYDIGDGGRSGSMGKVGERTGTPEFSSEAVPQDYSADGNSVKAAMKVVKDKLIAIQRNKEFVTILGYTMSGNESQIEKWDNCIITDISFDTSPDSGYAIYPNISIERVNVVQVKVQFANAEKIIVQKVADGAATTDGKGNKQPIKGANGTGDPSADTNQENHKPRQDRNADAMSTRDNAKSYLIKLNSSYKNGIIGTIGD